MVEELAQDSVGVSPALHRARLWLGRSRTVGQETFGQAALLL